MSIFLIVTGLVLFTGLGTDGTQEARNLNTAGDIFDQLTNTAVFSSTVFIVLTLGAVFVLRKREPDTPRPYLVPGYPVVPALALLVNGLFLILVAIDDLKLSAFSIGFLIISIPIYYAFSRSDAEDPPADNE